MQCVNMWILHETLIQRYAVIVDCMLIMLIVHVDKYHSGIIFHRFYIHVFFNRFGKGK